MVSIHLLHIVSQHFITEDVVILVIEKAACNADAVCHTRRKATYSVGYDSRSLDTSRLDGLEDIHHTFCLQTFQLRVDTQERSTPHYPITGREVFSENFKEVQRNHSNTDTRQKEDYKDTSN